MRLQPDAAVPNRSRTMPVGLDGLVEGELKKNKLKNYIAPSVGWSKSQIPDKRKKINFRRCS